MVHQMSGRAEDCFTLSLMWQLTAELASNPIGNQKWKRTRMTTFWANSKNPFGYQTSLIATFWRNCLTRSEHDEFLLFMCCEYFEILPRITAQYITDTIQARQHQSCLYYCSPFPKCRCREVQAVTITLAVCTYVYVYLHINTRASEWQWTSDGWR